MKTTQEKPKHPNPTAENNTERSNYLIGLMLAIVGAMLFSVRPILVKFAYQDGIDSVSLLTLRMLFSLPFYAVLFLYFLRDVERRKTLKPRLIAFTAVIGLCGYYAASLLDLIGLQYISAQLERLLLFTYPTLVVIFGALFFRQKITGTVILALAFSYGGIASIFTHDSSCTAATSPKAVFLLVYPPLYSHSMCCSANKSSTKLAAGCLPALP